jgi:hypothetical protein
VKSDYPESIPIKSLKDLHLLKIFLYLYRGRESNPHSLLGEQDFKSCVSTSSTTTATEKIKKPENPAFFYRAGDEARTRDLHLGKVALYQLSYSRMIIRPDMFFKNGLQI